MALLKVVILLGFMVLASESCGSVQTSPAAAAEKNVLLTVTAASTVPDGDTVTKIATGTHKTILEDALSHYDKASFTMKYLLEGVSCDTAKEIAAELEKATNVEKAVVKC